MCIRDRSEHYTLPWLRHILKYIHCILYKINKMFYKIYKFHVHKCKCKYEYSIWKSRQILPFFLCEKLFFLWFYIILSIFPCVKSQRNNFLQNLQLLCTVLFCNSTKFIICTGEFSNSIMNFISLMFVKDFNRTFL